MFNVQPVAFAGYLASNVHILMLSGA